MSRSVVLTFGLLLLPLCSSGSAVDPPDWSKFHSSGKVKGVIEKVGKETLTLSVPKLERNPAGGYRGARNRRPSFRVGHEDLEFSFADQGLVRWSKLPKKSDGKDHTAKELEESKKPIGATGYAATHEDLKAGQIVELHLVHPSSISDAKLTAKDIVIKFAVIEGETTPPPHADKPKSDEKKK